MNKVCIYSKKNLFPSCTALLFLFMLFSCREEKKIQEFYCRVNASIKEFPDSSFFSNVADIIYEEGSIYALDAGRRDIAVFDENFGNFRIIGTPGAGPEELANPHKFYVFQDTVYVLDYGDSHIKFFGCGAFAGSIKLNGCNNTRFFCRNNNFYFSCTTDSSSIMSHPKYSTDEGTYFGNLIRYDVTQTTQIRNDRHLLPAGNSFFAVLDNYPVIEEYDMKSEELISTIDLSEVPIIKENLSNIEKQTMAPNQYYKYIDDAYVRDNMLYVLCANVGGENYRVNTIIKISLEKKEVVCTYKLPGELYKVFCVTPYYIFAFEKHNCRIERFKLDDYE